VNPTQPNNPCGLYGIDFVEFVSPEPEKLDALFKAFGFSKVMHHQSLPVDLFSPGTWWVPSSSSSSSAGTT